MRALPRSAAARTLGATLATVEERTFAHLQRLDAKCDARSHQIRQLHEKVAKAAHGARTRQLDSWTRQLATPLVGDGA